MAREAGSRRRPWVSATWPSCALTPTPIRIGQSKGSGQTSERATSGSEPSTATQAK